MIRSAMAALATALATALLATVLAGSAAAQFPNMCKSYPADWTLSLIEYPDNWLRIVHGPSDYADPLCSRYLLDVKPTLGHDVILKAATPTSGPGRSSATASRCRSRRRTARTTAKRSPSIAASTTR